MTLLSPVAVVGHDLAYGAELLSTRSLPFLRKTLLLEGGFPGRGGWLFAAAFGGSRRSSSACAVRAAQVVRCLRLPGENGRGFPAGEHREVTLDCQRHHVPRAGGGAGRPGLRPPPPPAPPALPAPPLPPSPPVHRPPSRHPCRSDDPCREL